MMTIEIKDGFGFVNGIAFEACDGDFDLVGTTGVQAVEDYVDSDEGQIAWETFSEDFKEGIFMWLEQARWQVN